MTWNLFIDDERFPPYSENTEWYIARNADEVYTYVTTFGMPEFISFDHDLGEGEKTGHDIAKMLIQHDMDTQYEDEKFSKSFDFYVHSQNPVGRNNIIGVLNSYLNQKVP